MPSFEFLDLVQKFFGLSQGPRVSGLKTGTDHSTFGPMVRSEEERTSDAIQAAREFQNFGMFSFHLLLLCNSEELKSTMYTLYFWQRCKGDFHY